MNKQSVILVITDYQKPFADDHILQMVSKARELADEADMKVCTVCIGSNDSASFHTLAAHGTDTIIFYEEKVKRSVKNLSFMLSEIISEAAPKTVLFPATDYGRTMAATLSARFEAGLTAECIDIAYNKEKDFDFTRAAVNDSVIARINCMNCDMGMCTVKKGVFVKRKSENQIDYDLLMYYIDNEKLSADVFPEILARKKYRQELSIDIEKAAIVFGVGRGLRDPQMLARLYKIAADCGAEVAGTRAVVEAGMMERERQVGQSGKSISPRIYVALGVSGASQHIVGIKNADIVIAVNSDPEAAIFDYADYMIVEDVGNIIEALEHILKKAA